MVDMTLIRPLKSKGFAFWYQSTHRLATIHSVQTDRVIIVILWKLMFHNSVEMQLKYSDIFSNRVNIVANFQKKSKIGQYLAKIWTKVCGYFFGPPCSTRKPSFRWQTRATQCNVIVEEFLPARRYASAGNRDRNVSVCLSITRKYCVNAKMISSPTGSPKTLVFWHQISSPNSEGFSPNGGLKEKWGKKIQRFSSFKRQYLVIVNAAARLIARKRKYDSISATLRDALHWLPIRQRVEFKLSVLVLNCMHNLAPSYLSTMCQPVADNAGRRHLRSHVVILLLQPQGRFDTALAASPWQDRPPGILFQHRYAAVI